MSIRIEGQTDVNPIETPRSMSSKSVETDGKTVAQTNGGAPAASTDQAYLSNASDLVALAKATTPAGRAEKISALAARVASGTYKPAASAVSRAIVTQILKNR